MLFFRPCSLRQPADAFSPGGTACEGYEPFDDSVAARVRARHRPQEETTGDACEPCVQPDDSIGARVRERREHERAADVASALCGDDGEWLDAHGVVLPPLCDVLISPV